MKACRLLISAFLMVCCCSCDAFMVYRLTVKDENGRGIHDVDVLDTENGLTLSTDSSGFIQLSKISGGIRPRRSKKVSLHKAGFYDTLATLMPGIITIKLRKQ